MELKQYAKEREYKCPVCKDIGWVKVEGTNPLEADYYTKCKCRLEQERMDRLEKVLTNAAQTGIRRGLREKKFNNFDQLGDQRLINAWQKATTYYRFFERNERSEENSFIICGQSGAGKTHLCMAIVNNLLERGIEVSYMPYRNAISDIKRVVNKEEAYEKKIKPYKNTRVLYIDDFLKGSLTGSDANIMYEIINQRYLNQLPIIISTEKSINELLEFDEAIGGRIIEMCKGNLVNLVGKDLNYRLKML